MPIVKKTKKPARQVKKKKPVSLAQTKAKRTKPTKNPAAYFGCMKACCQKGIKPKKITEIARDCKHNALTINAKLSVAKTQAAKKIKAGYEQLGKGLAEFIASK